MFWDIEDEQICKSILMNETNLDKLKEKHGNEFTCKWIPLPPLNKEWNDEDVYKYFKLSENEIKLIKEAKVIGYNDVKQIDVNEPKIIKDMCNNL